MTELPEQPNTTPLAGDQQVRHHGRLGLAPSWQRIPWWGVIILIAGVLVGYSMLTNARYLDAISFIFDLPWDRRPLASQQLGDDPNWSLQVVFPLDPGDYTLYPQYQDDRGNPIGRGPEIFIHVPPDTPAVDQEPIRQWGDERITLETTIPAFSGTAPAGQSVVLVDDFSHRPLRIVSRMLLSRGVFLTFRVTVISFAGALVLGLVFGLMRMAPASPDLTEGLPLRLLIGAGLWLGVLLLSPNLHSVSGAASSLLVIEALAFLIPALPYTISTLYVELIRGVPMLVIVLYMGFAITPALRDASQSWGLGTIDLGGLPAATIALAFGYGAYLAEVYRAGIQSIPRGQMEAARSIGMTYFQAMRHVILPQAIRVVLPPLGNDFIALLKDTSLISVVALPEILQQGRLWVSRNFRAFEGYNSVAMLYLIMTLLLSLLVRALERRTAIER